MILPFEIAGRGHAGRSRDRRAGMARIKDVVLAFLPLREAAEAVHLAESIEFVSSAGQDFVDIGLMAYIPDDLVAGTVKDPVQSDGQLYDPQIGSQMAPGFRYVIDQKIADCIR